jgi:hypothetical protein
MEACLTPKLVKTSLHKTKHAHRYHTYANEDVYILSSKPVVHEFREGTTVVTDHDPKIVLQLPMFRRAVSTKGPCSSLARRSFVTAECHTSSSTVDKIAIDAKAAVARLVLFVPQDRSLRSPLRRVVDESLKALVS